MPLRPLIITETTRQNIKIAVEKARAKTIPWSVLRQFAIGTPTAELKLSDRPPGSDVLIERSESVHIARGYRANISFEEQPAGIIRHLSVSVDKKGKLPSPAAMAEPATDGIRDVWEDQPYAGFTNGC